MHIIAEAKGQPHISQCVGLVVVLVYDGVWMVKKMNCIHALRCHQT